MMCGCRRSWRYWISRSTRPAMSFVTSFRLDMIFNATFCPVDWCIASLTLPKEPSPRVLTTLYAPSLSQPFDCRGGRAIGADGCRCDPAGSPFASLVSLEPRRVCDGYIDNDRSSSSSVDDILTIPPAGAAGFLFAQPLRNSFALNGQPQCGLVSGRSLGSLFVGCSFYAKTF